MVRHYNSLLSVSEQLPTQLLWTLSHQLIIANEIEGNWTVELFSLHADTVQLSGDDTTWALTLSSATIFIKSFNSFSIQMLPSYSEQFHVCWRETSSPHRSDHLIISSSIRYQPISDHWLAERFDFFFIPFF